MIWLRNIVVANVITTIAFFELTELERCCCRIEKEKSQLKAESDDLRAQIEHIGKTKVNGLLISKCKCKRDNFIASSAAESYYEGALQSQ